nr:amidase [Actinomycetota bacterium]
MTEMPATLAALARAYREDRLSPVEVVKVLLGRIEADETGAFITVTAERALEDAARAEEELRSGMDKGPL